MDLLICISKQVLCVAITCSLLQKVSSNNKDCVLSAVMEFVR